MLVLQQAPVPVLNHGLRPSLDALEHLRSMMKAPGSLTRIQKAVAGVSGQFTRHRLTSRQPRAVGYEAGRQTSTSWSSATR